MVEIERSQIAARLIDSMDDADPNELKLSPAWQEEIAARMESICQGTAKLIPHDEVMVGIRSKLAAQSNAKDLA